MKEKLNYVNVKLDGGKVGVVEGVGILASSENELGIVNEVKREEKGWEAGVNEVNNRIPPEYSYDTKNQHNQTEHEQIWTVWGEITFRQA